jgi:hypothetical protein
MGSKKLDGSIRETSEGPPLPPVRSFLLALPASAGYLSGMYVRPLPAIATKAAERPGKLWKRGERDLAAVEHEPDSMGHDRQRDKARALH